MGCTLVLEADMGCTLVLEADLGCTLVLEADMGWLRSVGAIQLYVSFEEYRLFCRAVLQRGPIILRSYSS